MLKGCSGDIALTEISDTLLKSMDEIANLLDRSFDSTDYTSVLEEQKAKIADPELTPSARMLREMRETDQPFFRLEKAYSERWAEHFRNAKLAPDVTEKLDAETVSSLQAQQDIEQSDSIEFKQYLKNFYAQYGSL